MKFHAVLLTLAFLNSGCTSAELTPASSHAVKPDPIQQKKRVTATRAPRPEPKRPAATWERVEVGGPVATKAPAPKKEAPPRSWTAEGQVQLTASVSNPNVLMPGDGLVHLTIDLEATKDAGDKRLPMNIALVIDRSGSMRGEKIEQTREAARHFVNQLTDADTLAIVSYSDSVRVDLPAAKMTESMRRQALDAISRIRAGGSTNLSGGLFRGQEEVARGQATGRVNRVILMSDGLANRGITDARALSTQAQRHAQQGTSVTTMGVGTDYNEDLMTSLADHASGNYYFIQESAEIAGVFSRELSKMFSTVAQATTVELLIEDGVELKQVFGYTFTRQGDKVVIPLAEMFAGQKRGILVALQVPVVREGNAPVGQITLRYSDPVDDGKAHEASIAAVVRVTKDKEIVEKSRNKAVEERVGEVQVATAMNTAANLLRDGDADQAQEVLRGAFEANEARIGTMGALGGSARLRKQSESLRRLEGEFDEVKAAPAKAASTIKATKASGRSLSR